MIAVTLAFLLLATGPVLAQEDGAGLGALRDAAGTGDGERFAVVRSDRLDQRDHQGRPIESTLNYSVLSDYSIDTT